MEQINDSNQKLSLIGLDKGSNHFNSIRAFLASGGIEFGKFELNTKAKSYSSANSVPDAERQPLIESFPEIVNKYKHESGYKSDVVCLYPEFEHLDFIMKMFGNVHYHFENEYWYFFDGRLGFTFYSPRGFKFNVIVEAGEYIQVPERIWQQCFFVTPHDRMKSMRFFTSSGTVVLPDIDIEVEHESCA